jgi:CRP/FNR family transcriptional regulator, cyclic AMP receptor protein
MREVLYFPYMGMEEKMLIIRKNDFLARLSPEEYNALQITHNYLEAPRNSYVYFDPPQLQKLYFIKEGYVKIGQVDEEGNDLVMDILLPGDVFGQFTLERQNMPGAYAQAYKDSIKLCAFSITDFEQLLNARPDLAIQFSKKIGHKLRKIESRIINLLQKDVRSRLLYFFYSLIQDRGTDLNALTLTNYFTHEDIARLTATSRQTVTTLVNQFEEEGIIALDRKNIRILDLKKLQKETRAG